MSSFGVHVAQSVPRYKCVDYEDIDPKSPAGVITTPIMAEDALFVRNSSVAGTADQGKSVQQVPLDDNDSFAGPIVNATCVRVCDVIGLRASRFYLHTPMLTATACLSSPWI